MHKPTTCLRYLNAPSCFVVARFGRNRQSALWRYSRRIRGAAHSTISAPARGPRRRYWESGCRTGDLFLLVSLLAGRLAENPAFLMIFQPPPPRKMWCENSPRLLSSPAVCNGCVVVPTCSSVAGIWLIYLFICFQATHLLVSRPTRQPQHGGGSGVASSDYYYDGGGAAGAAATEAAAARRQSANIWLTVGQKAGRPVLRSLYCCGCAYRCGRRVCVYVHVCVCVFVCVCVYLG